MITVKKTVYHPWGDCLYVTDGKTELYASIEFGPRIIRLNAAGQDNIFFEDIQQHVSNDLSAYPGYFPSDTWRIYGGHRLWAAPEQMPRTYLPDHEPVEFELKDNGFILKQPLQQTVQTQSSMEITMAEDGTITVDHSITNHNAWPVSLAPWGISALCKDGLEIIPLTQEDTGLLPNSALALWPYTKMNDPRVTWGERYISLRQDQRAASPFKLGLSNTRGYAAYFARNCLFIKSFTHRSSGTYPDLGMSFETYTSNEFLEMETLGELVSLKPGESAQHTEIWRVYPNVIPPSFQDESEIDACLSSYLK